MAERCIIAGESYDITWTNTVIDLVKLEYTVNGGSNWSTIVSYTDASTGTYQWNVPDKPSDECLIRISNSENSSFSDQSDEYFTIIPQPSLTLISPNGGEKLIAASLNEITWSCENVDILNIDYSLDGGSGWMSIASGIDVLPGVYSWTVPDTVSVNCLVRITDAQHKNYSDQSDVCFSISEPPAPEIEITTTIEFGSVPVDSTEYESFLISNTGLDTLFARLSIADAEFFTVSPDTVAIIPGDNKTITVAFHPDTIGNHKTTITILCNDTDEETVFINVSGTGTGSIMVFSPESLSLGNMKLGTTINSQILITNKGNGVLSITNFSANISFLEVIPTSLSIEPGESDTVTVLFTPEVTGVVSGKLFVASDAETGSLNITGEVFVFEIINSELSDAVVGTAYEDTIDVECSRTVGNLEFKLIDAPEWMSINNQGIISGTPELKNAGTDIPFTVIAESANGLADSITTSITVKLDTYISFDLEPEQYGYQGGGSLIENPGPDELFGFAVYIQKNINIRGFTIDFTWDITEAYFRESKSGPNINDDVLDINGQKDVVFTKETNILLSDNIGSLYSVVDTDTDGHYEVSCEKIGGNAITATEGLLYMVVFKTASDITSNDMITISVRVTIRDDDGREFELESKNLIVSQEIAPPTNVTVLDVPDDSGCALQILWTLSADDDIITHYNIYRSRSSVFTDPIPLDSFSSFDELIESEKSATILVGTVPAGQTSFIDTNVPVNNVIYYYWLQAVREDETSEKVVAMYTETEIESSISEFRLAAPYPNPFNPSTTIDYYLPDDMRVTLTVFNVSGQQVALLEDNIVSAGNHSVVWEALNMPSGLYFITLKTEEFVETNKVLLMK